MEEEERRAVLGEWSYLKYITKMRAGYSGNEKLGSVRVGTAVRHWNLKNKYH